MGKKLDDLLSTRANNFDIIRFTAALAVIFSHSFDLTTLYDMEPVRRFSNGDSSIGEIAVAVFFVTSGFLITQAFNRAKSIGQFFQARVLRIYPALIVVTLLTVFVLGPILTTSPLSKYFLSLDTVKYLFNATSVKISFHLPGVFNTNPFPRDAVNGSLWSLPYELLCYLLVAIIGAFFQKRFSLVAVLGFVMLFFLPFMSLEKLLFFGFYFLCGAMFYQYRSNVLLNPMLFAIALSAFILNLGYNPYLIPNVIINGICLSYVVIFIAALNVPSLHHFAKYGDFSYGLYVWAFPVQQVLYARYPAMNNYTNFFFGSLITLVLAALSWHLIEKRALKLKNYPLDRLRNPLARKTIKSTGGAKIEG